MRRIGLLVALVSALSAQQVRFPVVVLDRGERFIKDLSAGHFRISENGVEQKVQGAEISPGGVSLGIVMDKSKSMSGPGPALEKLLVDGLASALQQSAPEDNFFAVFVSQDAFLGCDFTRDRNELARALQKAGFRGGTALRDGLDLSLRHLDQAKNPKRGILLVADGRDNASQKTQEEVEDRLAHSRVPLFVFDLTPPSKGGYGVYGVPLEALARDGGGWYRQGLRRGDADAYLLWIRDFLRAQYTLTYTPTKPAPAGKWRNVKVQVKGLEGRKGVRTVAPTGYFAP